MSGQRGFLRSGSRVNTRDPGMSFLGGNAWIDVRDFGAIGNGVVDDSAAFQRAADAVTAEGGGELFVPGGTWRISRCIYIGGGTIMQGVSMAASIIKAAPVGGWSSSPYSMVRNSNHTYNGGAITDENITVQNLFFDYSDFGVAPGGGAHAVSMRYVRNVRVLFVRARDGENLHAFLGCEDTLVMGCHATGQINCPYDHWAGAGYARVLGNFCDVDAAPQVCNFNGLGDGQTTQTSSSIIIAGNHFISRRLSNPSSISLSPLGTASATRRIIITHNDLANVRIAGQGNVTDVVIDSNQMRDNVNGTAAILAYSDGVHTPARWKISNNIITGMATQSPELAVIDFRGTDSSVTDNTIKGSLYNWGVRFATENIASGNDIEAGTSGTILGPYAVQSDDSIVLNGRAHGWRTSVGDVARFKMQTDDNLVFQGTDAAGNPRQACSWQQNSDTAPWRFTVPVTLVDNLVFTPATVAAAGTTITGATVLVANLNHVTSCTAGVTDGVSLTASDGLPQTVVNETADVLKVYPNNSGTAQIDAGGASVPATLAAGKSKTFSRNGAGNFRTIAAT